MESVVIDLSFEKAFKFTLENEGGMQYTNNPDDSGGPTKGGISQKSFPDLDIRSLTAEDIRNIYKTHYWDKQPYENMDDTQISTKLFDLSFHIGALWANKICQRAIRSCTAQELKEDGIIGPITLGLINQNIIGLLFAIKSEAAGYYRSLVIKRPLNQTFLDGWLNRAYK